MIVIIFIENINVLIIIIYRYLLIKIFKALIVIFSNNILNTCSACGDARQPQRRAGALEREGEQSVAEKQAYAWAVRSDD